jgi:glycosyltransferase involved in cell wall biosynthesis
VHIGPAFALGGAEQHIIDLARFLDPRRVRLEKCLVTGEGYIDCELTRRMPAPVMRATCDDIAKAVSQYDVTLFWGRALAKLPAKVRSKLSIHIAHGESSWSRDCVVGTREVTDHVIAVSQRVRDRVCHDVPATVVLNGVDAARLACTRSREAVREACGFSPGDFVVGFVARFSAEKRPRFFLEMVAALPRRFKALMIGWGEMRNDLLNLANDIMPGRYALVRARDYLGDYYQAMDAFCLLSAHEGFGLVALEAQLCGRPLVATSVGCIPEIVRDRVNGLVVEATTDSVSQALRCLDERPQWAAGIARQGQADAAQFGHAARMARDYENLLEKLWRAKHGSLPRASKAKA